MKVIAITGGTGFIGRRLAAQHVARGDEVRLLSRRCKPAPDLPEKIAYYYGDLRTCGPELSRFLLGADTLYHCAAEVHDHSQMTATNVRGTEKLVKAAAGRVRHWVQLSSVGAYGRFSEGIVTEDSPLNAVGPYEITKLQSDRLIERHGSAGAFTYTILRPSNVFGPSMTNQSLFELIGAVERRMFFFIGRPGASANYIAVENVVDALVLCGTMPQARGRVYNLSDQRPIEEFITTIAVALGVSPPRHRLPEAPVRRIAKVMGKFPRMPLTEGRVDALVNRCVYSISRIERELGYFHRVSMEEALWALVRTWKCARGRVSA
jgi:nucleoside-diphosphate-sugar epimerase